MFIGTCFRQGGLLFLNHFLELLFSLKIVIVDKNGSERNQNEVMWNLFFRKNAKTKKCVSTAQARADCM